MKTNDLKTGTIVLLRNGFEAIIKDNMRGNIRTAEVHGVVTEVGSIYAHNILEAYVDGKWVKVEHTPAQLKLMQTVNILF